MSLLEVKNLTVSFEGRTVFKDLSFNVEKGDYLCILGENGSGKTTLMRCILGFPFEKSEISSIYEACSVVKISYYR